MTDFPTLFLLLIAAALAAAPVAGFPFRDRAPEERPAVSEVATRDKRLLHRTGAAAAALAVLALLGALDARWAWIALAVATAVVAPVALDRWERTNGARSPYRRLRREADRVATVATPPAEMRDELAIELLDTIDGAAPELIARVAASAAPRWLACRLLAARTIRTGEDGASVWRAGAAGGTRADRAALAAILSAHPSVLDEVLPLLRP